MVGGRVATNNYHVYGVDGSIWDIGFGDKVQITSGGLEGIDLPPVTIRTRRAAGTDGQARAAARYEARSVYLPVQINANLPAHMLEITARAWWNAWSPDEPSRLVITSPSGIMRTLWVYLEGDSSPTHEMDPHLAGFQMVGMRLTADDPWFYGAEVAKVFPKRPEQNFFGPLRADGDRKGPPFYLFPETVTGEAFLANPGDREAWPIWTVEGPANGFIFTTGVQTLSGKFVIPDGHRVVLDSRPGHKSAFLEVGETRTNITRQLLSWGFGSIPPGEQARVIASVDGEGTASVRFLPRYKRGW